MKTEQNSIRIANAELKDLDALYEIELLAFPIEKAASKEAFVYRLTHFPQWFYKAEIEGRIVGLINGSSSDQEYITDDLYAAESAYHDTGENLLIYGLAVHPDYRHGGIAHQLMQRILSDAGKAGKRRAALTCKESLIGFYEHLGYRNHGVSQSVIGNAVSYDMEILLK